MVALVSGLFGLIIGSFLNVAVLRRGIRSLAGRSGCLSCRAPIAWYDNIPLLSYVILQGRCRACGSRISMLYPLVELSTALLFAALAPALFLAPAWQFAQALGIASVLVAIAAYDVRHTIIPDAWAYLFAVLAFALGAFVWMPQFGALYLLSGPFAALPLFLLWLVSRGTWMGLGDAKLALGIGYLLGPVDGVFAVFLAFVIGAVFALGILLPLQYIHGVLVKAGIAKKRLSRSYTMKSEVPFGPFLIASCVLVWLTALYHIPIVPWY